MGNGGKKKNRMVQKNKIKICSYPFGSGAAVKLCGVGKERSGTGSKGCVFEKDKRLFG